MQYLKFLLVITMSTFINAKNICSSGYEFGYVKTLNNKDIYNCIQCPEDFYSNKNTKYCISCPPGHIANKGSSVCHLCTIEMYKNKLCKLIRNVSDDDFGLRTELRSLVSIAKMLGDE